MTIRPDISVILPVRDGADASHIDAALSIATVDRVIAVDVGAPAPIAHTLATRANGRVKVVALPEAAGWGAAVRRGVRAAEDGDRDAVVVALQPGDAAGVIEALADAVRHGADVAVGRSPRRATRWGAPAGSFASRVGVLGDLELNEDGHELTEEVAAQAQALGLLLEVWPQASSSAQLRPAQVVRSKVRWSSPAVRRRQRLARRRRPRPWNASDAELASTLDDLDGAHNYADWIVALMAPHLTGRILEVGAGHGTFTSRLVEFGHVTATELSERAVALLDERYAGSDRVTVCRASELGEGPFDTAIMINVLEHIENDVAALQGLREQLSDCGHVLVFAPAFNALYSPFDAAVGHYRRYTRATLQRAIRDADLELVDLRYVNAPGALAWYVVATRLGRRPTETWLKLYDRAVVPVVRRIEERLKPPFGQSLLAVARRPQTPCSVPNAPKALY
jgi:2-polyprenyl-3-methyl-5-hydroxy-6-metoxy-1,4-benzoquinol methylase